MQKSDRASSLMKPRIFHGPITIAGIGNHLSEWQRRKGLISDFISYGDADIVDKAHIDMKVAEYGLLAGQVLRILLFGLCLVRYNVFHFYFGKTLLPFQL